MAPWPPPSWCNSGNQTFGLEAARQLRMREPVVNACSQLYAENQLTTFRNFPTIHYLARRLVPTWQACAPQEGAESWLRG